MCSTVLYRQADCLICAILVRQAGEATDNALRGIEEEVNVFANSSEETVLCVHMTVLCVPYDCLMCSYDCLMCF